MITEKHMKLAHYGTFDVDNYGDLLFPKIIEWRLPDWEVQHVSPTASTTRFTDAIQARKNPTGMMQAYITGGGNIFHFQSTPLPAYSSVSKNAYSRLIVDPIVNAAHYGVPYLINGPSLSSESHTALESLILRRVLARADYISFRDSYSTEEVRARTNAEVHCVPDTALDIARMWPVETSPLDGGYIVVHVNRRYGGSASDTAKALDQIGNATGLHIRLLPIGPCHGDVEYMHEVSEAMMTRNECCEDYTLRGFAETIARSHMYLGSSMHGFITALSYDRPCLLVLGPNIKSKFIGVLDICGLPTTAIQRSWQEAAERDCPVVRMTSEQRAVVFDQLDAHWERVRLTLERTSNRKHVSVARLKALVWLAQTELRLRKSVRRKLRRVPVVRAIAVGLRSRLNL